MVRGSERGSEPDIETEPPLDAKPRGTSGSSSTVLDLAVEESGMHSFVFRFRRSLMTIYGLGAPRVEVREEPVEPRTEPAHTVLRPFAPGRRRAG